MRTREILQRWRYNFFPDHLIGEILSKRWADNAIPFLAMVVTVVGFGTAIPGFFKPNSLVESTRQLGEFSIVVTGLTVVMLAGGIDLSVSSIFALAAFASVSCLFILGWPVWACLLAALAVGGAFGAVNGYLIGYLRLRAFLTTLVTLVIGRSLYDILIIKFAAQVQ
jgi:ribose transport system permease protein